ncbi:MAG: zinc-binding dehydrogenase [Thermoplasmata archaeon]|nr:zinc-binding dehydrogenase [Thermoplasmata archaeon]
MKAVAIDKHGGPEVLAYRDLPDPEIGEDEVLVRLEASALNRLDLFVREGWPSLRLTFPHVLGADGAGVVEAVGKAVDGTDVGTRVVVDPSLPCGICAFCRRGEEVLCVEYRILGEHVDGTYAELVGVPEANVLPLPDGIPLEPSAAAPLTFMTAWRLLVTRAAVRPGETVLVLGAGGGVASAAIQIARHAGARVIATTSTKEKVERARQIGADEVINYREEPFERVAWELSGKKGVDVVVDCVGEATWKGSIRSLAKNGRLVTCGATTGPMGETDLRYIFWRQLQILGSTMANRAEFREVMRLIWEGQLTPVVDRTFPLRDARAAQEYLERGEQFGKVLLRP